MDSRMQGFTPRHLQEWYDEWCIEHRDTDLLFGRSSDGRARLSQVHFVRDNLAPLFWLGVPYEDRLNAPPPRDDCKVSAVVIGEHHSKSVRLPVYMLERADLGLKLVLRDNFYDWNVSVVSIEPVAPAGMRGFPCDFTKRDCERFPQGHIAGRSWGYCYFQGFPDAYTFGPYVENAQAFSFWTGDDYQLYAFLWRLIHDRVENPDDAG